MTHTQFRHKTVFYSFLCIVFKYLASVQHLLDLSIQVRALIQILKHFDWTWAGLLVTGDDYGVGVARTFQSELAESGVGCLAYLEVLPWDNDPPELRRIVDLMRLSTARVVMVFAHETHMLHLMDEVGIKILDDMRKKCVILSKEI